MANTLSGLRYGSRTLEDPHQDNATLAVKELAGTAAPTPSGRALSEVLIDLAEHAGGRVSLGDLGILGSIGFAADRWVQ